jgi:hypothetical protein
MIAMARSLAEASKGTPSKTVQRLAFGLIRDRLQAMRGPTAPRPGRTRRGAQSDQNGAGSDQGHDGSD